MIEQKQPLSKPLLQNVEITSGFWGERQAANRERTIPAIYHQMKDTGHLDAWRLDWQPGQPKPHIFWDSDTGKWIEAAGYSLATHPDPDLERQVDALVDLIAAAQQPDGYLNVFFTVCEPHNRWRNLRDWHELYDAGHLIEGAVAYAQATGKRKLLEVLCRYTDLIDRTFGPKEGQKRGYCGHPEVELALVKLYHATGERRYLDLAAYFVDERGQQPNYFDVEARERGDDPAKFWAKTYRYCQADVPVREQTQATGHSVRACYLYSGMADIATETGDADLLAACRSIWDDLTEHQMYITGGLGPAHANEGFTFAYDLPNETAYAETCASIALVLWAHRMVHLDPDGRYIDVMERALYNGILSGVSFRGDTFFYANPLAAYPYVNPVEHWSGINSAHDYRREAWFGCACCPPNLARLVASIGNYFYSTTSDTLYVHLYNHNRASFTFSGNTVHIEHHTDYPWSGDIRLTIETDQPTQFDLALRIPGWCREHRVTVNGTPVTATPTRGYLHLERTWVGGDEVTLTLAMPVERMLANPHVRHDAGLIALQRGPVVYCLEETDNGAELANLAIPRGVELTAGVDAGLFGGVGVITGQALRIQPTAWPGGLYQPESVAAPVGVPVTFKAIPYCFWANRQPGEMRVWLRET
ncbi:MAG: glycoside hydrolase family 127 protein [Anaerolineae bacterium]